PAVFNREPYNLPGEQRLADTTPPEQASGTKRIAKYLLDHFPLARMAAQVRLERTQVYPSKLRWNYVQAITDRSESCGLRLLGDANTWAHAKALDRLPTSIAALIAERRRESRLM